MATINLHPGDTLNLVVDIVKGPTGLTNVVMPFVYEDLIDLLRPRRRRKNGSNPGGKVSRQINLFCQALEKGIWTTGAPINRTDIARKLTELLNGWLTDEAHTPLPLTQKAVDSLSKLKAYEGGLGADLSMAINQALKRNEMSA